MVRLIKNLFACKPTLFRKLDRRVKAASWMISFDGRIVRLYLPEV
jgi:hypothetical protein